jgi:DNA-directed RNA polymerase subunit RPC12/RpoP
MSNKETGDKGELEVCKLVPCPNCGNKLVLLPQGFPMYDVQCSRCLFRAQVKTVNSKPKNSIFGAGYDIYEKVLKAGFLSPPLIVNFKWKTKEGLRQEIHFYPFIAKGNVQKYKLSPTAKRANYRMFKYTKLDKIPRIIVYSMLNPNIKPSQV